MAFDVAVYDVGESLFQSRTANSATPKSARRAAKLSPAEELEAWRKRAEEITRNYQKLVKNYRQLKSHLKQQAEWHQRCNAMAAGALRNCRELEFALTAARKQGGDEPGCTALIAGIEQVLENQLLQLREQGLIEGIEPQPAEIPDETLHEVVGTRQTDEFAEGLIAEVAEIGYACSGKPIRKAKVVVAAPANGNDTHQEINADGV